MATLRQLLFCCYRGQDLFAVKNKTRKTVPAKAAQNATEWEEGKWKDYRAPPEGSNQEPVPVESHGKPRPFKSDDLEQTSPPCPSAACPPTIDIEIEAHQSEQLVKGLSPDTKPDTEEQKEYDKTVLPEREVFINRPSLPTFSNADQQPSQKSKEQDVDEDKGLETSSLEMVVDNPNESQTLQTTHTFLINPQESRPTPPETTQEKHESANSLDITTSNSTSQDLASHSGSESHVESKHMVSISFAPQIKKPLMMEVTPDTDDARFLNTKDGEFHGRNKGPRRSGRSLFVLRHKSPPDSEKEQKVETASVDKVLLLQSKNADDKSSSSSSSSSSSFDESGDDK